MPIDIKICGLKRPSSVEAAAAGGATHAGFIFFRKSPRHLTPQQAREAAGAANGSLKTVAVTVDATDDELDDIIAVLRPDMLQLHGSEPPLRLVGLKARYRLPVMKALPVRDAADLAAIKPYLGIADRFLLDAKPPKGAELPGGNGAAFDWSILADLDPTVDYMLSGGVNSGNVDAAVLGTAARGVDISSGVETSPGEKDDALIKKFLARVREAEKSRPATAKKGCIA